MYLVSDRPMQMIRPVMSLSSDVVIDGMCLISMGDLCCGSSLLFSGGGEGVMHALLSGHIWALPCC